MKSHVSLDEIDIGDVFKSARNNKPVKKTPKP